jgi:hypothetical protein
MKIKLPRVDIHNWEVHVRIRHRAAMTMDLHQVQKEIVMIVELGTVTQETKTKVAPISEPVNQPTLQ